MSFTEEEKIALFKALENIQKGIDILTDDRGVDAKASEAWHKDTLIAVGKITPEIQSLSNKLDSTRATVKHEVRDAAETMVEVGASIEDNLAGKTRIIEKKIVEHFDLLRPLKWFLKPFRRAKKEVIVINGKK